MLPVRSFITLSSLFGLALGLGSSCSSPLGNGHGDPDTPYWLETIKHQGTSPFNPNSTLERPYQVFRNVKDFGAKGDGKHDDTAAIQAAMTLGNRCGNLTCESSSLTPAVVYIPQGTYLVSDAIDAYFYTQIIGDAKRPPTLLASKDFKGYAVIDADPSKVVKNASEPWYINQDSFYRSVRNVIIDTRQMKPEADAIGIHWEVSQSTSLVNVVVEMSQEKNTNHVGLYMEAGSGGFMGDLVFNGGKIGMSVGNQQFTVRNATFNNVIAGVNALWNWGWTFQGITANGCEIAFNLTTGSVGSEAIVDAIISDTKVFVSNSAPSHHKLNGSLVLNNAYLHNVPVAVGIYDTDEVVLEGSEPHGDMHIDNWAQGNAFVGTSDKPHYIQKYITPINKPWNIVTPEGKIYGRGHPQYPDLDYTEVMSVKSEGAKGDGRHDDTEVLQRIIDEWWGCKLIFFDAGAYYITDTLYIPAGTQIVGEAWSQIIGGGPKFADEQNPHVVVRVGNEWDQGITEISDMLFTTRGPAPGAIIMEWNAHEPADQQGGCGMWDTIFRIGGAAGTNLQEECPAGNLDPKCQAAFLGLHLTQSASAYLEGTWVWTADHDVDNVNQTQLSIFSARGILSESYGPVWMIGTASEHNTLYQYNLHQAQNHWIGFAQTETPYYQPVPNPPAPFQLSPKYHDPPSYFNQTDAWAIYVRESWDITIFGAGLYNFFKNYTQACLSNTTCQTDIFNIDDVSTIQIYSLTTVGTTYQLDVRGKSTINATLDSEGFQDTATLWQRWSMEL